MSTEADTCRTYIVPKLHVADWGDDFIAERHAERTLGLSGTLRRSLPADRPPDARRGGPDRREFRLRIWRGQETIGGNGFADVFKRRCFALEYKGKRADLDKAYQQSLNYREALQNPPFLGGGKIRAELGDAYTEALFKLYGDRLPNFSDLVCYWFGKARAMIEQGKDHAKLRIAGAK